MPIFVYVINMPISIAITNETPKLINKLTRELLLKLIVKIASSYSDTPIIELVKHKQKQTGILHKML